MKTISIEGNESFEQFREPGETHRLAKTRKGQVSILILNRNLISVTWKGLADGVALDAIKTIQTHFVVLSGKKLFWASAFFSVARRVCAKEFRLRRKRRLGLIGDAGHGNCFRKNSGSLRALALVWHWCVPRLPCLWHNGVANEKKIGGAYLNNHQSCRINLKSFGRFRPRLACNLHLLHSCAML